MKTEDLIKALSNDAKPVNALSRTALWSALAGAAGGLILFLVLIQARADFGPALGTWRFSLKLAVLTAALLAMAWECVSLLRPGRRMRTWPIIGVASVLIALIVIELLSLPAGSWSAAAMGANAMHCMRTIPFLAALPLIGVLTAMRHGAPSSPTAAGAVAGGVSAAFGGLLYATHCTDDSPLFVAIWYPLGAAFVVGFGALVGRYVLRW
jgi:hypothetical protein